MNKTIINISKLLKDKNITVKDMSNELEISRQHVYNKLNGKNEWTFKEIVIISKKTKTPLSEFEGMVLKDLK